MFKVAMSRDTDTAITIIRTEDRGTLLSQLILTPCVLWISGAAAEGQSPKVHICPPPVLPPAADGEHCTQSPAQAFQADKTETVVFFSFPAPAGVFTGL